jgi:hypothetical protein
LHGFLQVRRSVIQTGKNMAMQVDHRHFL